MAIEEKESGNWLHLENPSAKENMAELILEQQKENHGNIGKYMFFSDDKQALIKVAREILTKYNLFHAKVPLSNIPRDSPGFGFVLCIYDSSPKLKMELRKFADEKNVKYRFWKRDAATLEGKYSKEFLAFK